MKELKVGIIGVDKKRRAQHAFLAHQPENGVRITAGADINQTAIDDFREMFGSDTFITRDYHEMLKADIDIVFVMTPDFFHEEQGIAVLKAGKVLYLEKPMSLSIEGCDRLLETAMNTNGKIFVGHNMRYFPSVLKMKEIIDSGIIGDIQICWCRHFVSYGSCYFRTWCSERRFSNGLLLQKGSHDIDVIHWLMGSYTKEVSGMGMLSVYDKCKKQNPGRPRPPRETIAARMPLEHDDLSSIIDIEDHNMIMMQLENGSQACYMQCHYTPDAERNYTFIGTKGRIENIGDQDDCEIHVWTKRGKRQEPDIIYKLKDSSGGHGGSDPAIINSFLDYVKYGKEPNASPLAARNAIAVGVMGHESMRSGGERKKISKLRPEIENYFRNK